MAIEKSVQTAFDVFDNTPLNALVDFGKFIWKENSSRLHEIIRPYPYP